MDYQTAQIAETLKKARQEKGLSQRALSERVGITQSQISKIENGTVDMRLSTLIELARTLEFELTLVPRKTLPAVQSVVRSSAPRRVRTDLSAVKELQRLTENINKFSSQFKTSKEFARLQHYVRDIERMQRQLTDSGALREINKTLQALKTFEESAKTTNAILKSAEKTEALRNKLVHSMTLPEKATPKPAYSLEEGDDG
jgi:transcriptional regulator with XRE-family HTH domain